MPAVDECERDAASAAGMIAMIGAGTVRPPSWMANGGRRGQVSAFGTKAVQRGVHSVHKGEWTPIGLWAVGTNEPHARDKTVHGWRRRRMAADMDKVPHLGRKPSRWAFIQLTEANAGHRVENDLREAGTDKFPRSGRKPSRGALVRFFAGGGHAPVMAGVFTCNTYSAAYKGKPSKKRLSPKSPNTLIHSCITFYKTLIFQYLSLWKSVFSHN